MRTGRLIGLVLAGALIGYGVLPFFSGGFVLVGAGVVLGAITSIGMPRGEITRGLLLGFVAGLLGPLVFIGRAVVPSVGPGATESPTAVVPSSPTLGPSEAGGIVAIFLGMTPWGQLLLVALVSVGGALLVTRLTRRPGYGWSYMALVLALASAALGLIATVAFVWAAILLPIGISVFVITLRTPRDVTSR